MAIQKGFREPEPEEAREEGNAIPFFVEPDWLREALPQRKETSRDAPF